MEMDFKPQISEKCHISLYLPIEVTNFCPNCGIKIEKGLFDTIKTHFEECLKNVEYVLNLGIPPKLLQKLPNRDDKVDHQCNQCHKFFANDKTLEKHRFFCDPNSSLAEFNNVKNQSEKPKNKKKATKVECPTCQKLFYPNYLPNHMNVHTGERPYKCKYCPKAFKDSTGLKTHHQSHENIKPYKCDICDDKAFRRLEDLKKHQLKHAGIKLHVCSFCAKSFSSLSTLNSHEKKIHVKVEEVERFNCDQCQAYFKTRSTLRDHQIRHHGRKGELFKCQHCPKDFTNPASLKNHLRTHTGERPFTCPYCPLKFKAKFHMESHSKRHTKAEGQFICLECADGFETAEELKQHSEGCHSRRMHSYPCDKCSKKFNRADLLNEHKKIHDAYQCPRCNNMFENMILFNEHECEEYLDLDMGQVEAITNVDDFMDSKAVVGIYIDSDEI